MGVFVRVVCFGFICVCCEFVVCQCVWWIYVVVCVCGFDV